MEKDTKSMLCFPSPNIPPGNVLILWDAIIKIGFGIILLGLKKEGITAGLCCQVVPEGLGRVSSGTSKANPEGRKGKINCKLMMMMPINFRKKQEKWIMQKIITNNAHLGKGWWEDWDFGRQDMEPGSSGSRTKPRRAGRVPQIPALTARGAWSKLGCELQLNPLLRNCGPGAQRSAGS